MTNFDSGAVFVFTLINIIVITLIFGFILYFVFGYRSKQRDNQILTTQKAEIESKNEIIKQTLADLNAAQNQLIQSEKLASLGELTAGIAHEIQNPLNFVNNFSEVNVDIIKDLLEEIKSSNMDFEYVKDLANDLSENQQKINSHGKRASNIVANMLEHSRQSSGIKLPTDINQLVDEYLRLSYHGMRAKDKSFNSEFNTILDENLPKIEVISQDIGRVLLNLINNAFYAVNQKNKKLKALDNGVNGYSPKVEVITKSTDKQIYIIIKDNGIGMNESTRMKIFQPFFTTKPTGEGTGLGLSLAYDIITKGHGGKLLVDSTENIGTEFTVIFPLK